ncbi:hypothetical protein [Campylobacter upsaliensis]|uniref:Uncharacterized protein n=1 Tax=Campylobacter upsaliensis TaxID=28080 RepID=A0A381EGE4_CAMUP|nr:hypothetical protein [Campylobacter upsaliensis]MCR2101621.1 hypothetical protein [Campylobacter upsaliensis]SUX25973.1 Uncharacterised protein [Campylobacter upsaliensis]SUX27506.1 Uncharacterised protein [Campylobacter upsaliensis]
MQFLIVNIKVCLELIYYSVTIKHLSVHYVKEGSGNRNLTIGTFDVKGDVKFEIKLGGKSTIDTLNNTAERLNIKVNKASPINAMAM